jgi:hypothetical protein
MTATSFDAQGMKALHASKRRRFALRLPTLRLGLLGGGLGLLIVAVGLLVIGIGWNGMAGAGGEVRGVPYLSAQLPWLVSGGILGLALVVFGAALLVVHNARTDRARLESKLDELVDVLSKREVGSDRGSVAAMAPAGMLVAGGSTYHRPDCRLVTGRDDVSFVTAGEASARELRPCRICRPAEADTLVH